MQSGRAAEPAILVADGIPKAFRSSIPREPITRALEQLVHLIRLRILNGYVLADISFDDARMQRLQPDDLPSGWNDPVAPATLKAYGDDWIAAGNYLVLAVPSAIIRGEWNYLINPTHPEFNALIKSNPESFMYDHRLA